MVELTAKPPVTGLPVTHGGATLALSPADVLISVQPFAGQAQAVSALLKTHHDVALPATGRMTGRAGARVYWAGQGGYFLTFTPDAALAGAGAALVDLSDGWTRFSLSGGGVEDILARLTPIDLRATAFRRGHVARGALLHIAALFARTGADSFDILVMRSFARSAAHDLTQAMKIVAARQ